MIIDFPGYPTEIGREIEFPEDVELLHQPIFDFAPIEWAMKNGSEFQKYLLNQVTLGNKTKYVFISSVVRVVYEGILVNKCENPNLGVRNEWHADVMQNPNEKVHSIANTLGTEFNTKPVSFEVPDNVGYDWFCKQSAMNADNWGLTPKSTPAKRFITFDRHIHRAQIPTKTEIRYFMRVNEMDKVMKGFDSGNYQRNISIVYNGKNPINNVIQNPDGTITIHLPKRI